MFRRAKPCRYVANSTHCVLRTCARSSPTAGNKKTDTPDLGVTLLRRISGREVKRREPSPRCFARRNRAAMLRTPRTACFALVHEVLRPQSAKIAIHHFGCNAPAENKRQGSEATRAKPEMFRTAKPCRYVTNSTHCVLRTCARSSPTAERKKSHTPLWVYGSFWCSCGESNSGHLD